jgi:hypothetical protein
LIRLVQAKSGRNSAKKQVERGYCFAVNADEAKSPRTMRGMASEFFITFALFEFALMQTGLVTKDRWKNAKADWDKFEELPAVVALFEGPAEEDSFRTALQFYRNAPPKRQTLDEQGYLKFEEDARCSGVNAKSMLTCVKNVRNNLFHGGKFGAAPLGDGDPQRSIELMCHGLVILRKCIEFTTLSSLKSAYENAETYFLNG